jgi:hypothetical protein
LKKKQKFLIFSAIRGVTFAYEFGAFVACDHLTRCLKFMSFAWHASQANFMNES